MIKKILPVLCILMLASCSNKNAVQEEVKPAEQPAAEAPAAEAEKPAADAQEAAPKADDQADKKADEAAPAAINPVVKITENGPEVTIQPSRNPDKVVVTLDKTQTIIDSEADFGMADDPLTVIQVMDINFDGSKDILVPTVAGMQNINYDVWIWNTDKNGFIKVGDLSSTSAPELNAEKKEIKVSAHVSAAESTAAVLTFKGDKMEVLRTLEIGPVEGKENTLARKVTTIKDGEKNTVVVEFAADTEDDSVWSLDF